MPTGIDQSWGYANPKAAAAAGVQVVSEYLSHDSSKNVTAADVRAYHAAGIGVLLNYESQPGAPLGGAVVGKADAATAIDQIRALINDVRYAPKSLLAVPFSCDKDVTSSQYKAIDDYYRETKLALAAAKLPLGAPGLVNGCYGEAALCDHLHAAGLTDMEWQTLAWSNGRISPQADFYQSSINNTLAGASVDFDQVIHAAQLGAWWPPNHPLNTRSPKEDDVTMLQTLSLLRGILLGGKYATKKLRTKHPRLVHETGLAEQVNKQGDQVRQLQTTVAQLKTELAAAKKAGA